MASQISSHRENAEVYTDEDTCKNKSIQLLQELNLPKGLLPLNDIIEVGHNKDTGFVWLKQKKATEHSFSAISRRVWYDKEVTAFVEDRKMKKLTGVKSNELFIWVTVSEICIPDPDSREITFATPSGISRSFPISAFEAEEEKR